MKNYKKEMMMRNNLPILLIEDDVVDAMTVKRALNELQITNPINTVGNGEEALGYLRNETSERPGLILLDLNMPKMSGVEFLKIIKNDDKLKRIPVVVLTTSKDEQDRFETFNSGVAGYMIKPVDYPQFVEIVRTIKMYWMLSETPE
jgi:CheY-like chemotaxis protein